MNSARLKDFRDIKIPALFHSCRAGDILTVKIALESGINVNVLDPVTTDSLLMVACRIGNVELVKLCLQYGAKNDPHPDYGQTALHAAVSENQLYAAHALLEIAASSEADIIISNLTDTNG